MKKPIILISSICLLLACNSEVENSQSKNKKETKAEVTTVQAHKESEIQAERANKKEKFLANEVSLEKEIKKTLLINNEKFIVHGETLQKGTKVFSPSIKQVGIVKGSTVIVTKKLDENQLTAAYKISSIRQLAENTFELFPNESVELYSFYLKLKSSDLIDRVELSIGYSGYRPEAEAQ
jgi:hypothetical protein